MMWLTLRPGEQSIGFSPGDNLLDTLLRADVPIAYSCLAGQCGSCRCKLHEEQVADGYTEQGRGARVVLACQTSLSGPCIVEIPEPDEIVVHPACILKGMGDSIEAPVEDVRIIRFRTNRSLAFSPGQFANIRFAPGLERSYSMASVADENLLEFHIRIVPDGSASAFVANDLGVGDTVRISGPLGTSYLRRKHEGPSICIGGGTGLAPVLSIARGSLEAGNQHPIHLYFGVRSQADIYGTEQLADLKRRFPNLVVHVVVANGPASECYRTGRITDVIAADWQGSDALAEFRGYVCGSPPMIDAVRDILVDRGLAEDWIYADAFFNQSDAQAQPA